MSRHISGTIDRGVYINETAIPTVYAALRYVMQHGGSAFGSAANDILRVVASSCAEASRSDGRPTSTHHSAIVPTSTRDTLSSQEFAERAGMTERHARRLAPHLGGFKKRGQWRIPESALNRKDLESW